MKQDIEDMIGIITNELEGDKLRIPYNELIKEIIELLKNNQVDEALENQLLSELYKFIKLGNTLTSIDPRGDQTIKHSALYGIKESLTNKSLTKENIESLKSVNDICLLYFLNPLRIHKESRDFYSQHPGARF